MRKSHVLLFGVALIGCASIVVGCRSGNESASPVVLDETPPAEAVERARDAADALGQELVAELFRQLEGGNPAQAIDVCAVRANELSEGLAEQGTRVRRVSRRFRNPANAPDAYESRKLIEFEDLKQRGRLPVETAEVVVGADGRRTLRYMRPILLKPPCKMCHGPVNQIQPEVLDAIHNRYPGDRALGFQVDDLRGAFSVEIDL